MQIRQKTLKKIAENQRLRNRLAYELGKDQLTIRKWIKENNTKLTTALSLSIISQELNLKQSEILEKI
jgi:hypothetical protein